MKIVFSVLMVFFGFQSLIWGSSFPERPLYILQDDRPYLVTPLKSRLRAVGLYAYVLIPMVSSGGNQDEILKERIRKCMKKHCTAETNDLYIYPRSQFLLEVVNEKLQRVALLPLYESGVVFRPYHNLDTEDGRSYFNRGTYFGDYFEDLGDRLAISTDGDQGRIEIRPCFAKATRLATPASDYCPGWSFIAATLTSQAKTSKVFRLSVNDSRRDFGWSTITRTHLDPWTTVSPLQNDWGTSKESLENGIPADIELLGASVDLKTMKYKDFDFRTGQSREVTFRFPGKCRTGCGPAILWGLTPPFQLRDRQVVYSMTFNADRLYREQNRCVMGEAANFHIQTLDVKTGEDISESYPPVASDIETIKNKILKYSGKIPDWDNCDITNSFYFRSPMNFFLTFRDEGTYIPTESLEPLVTIYEDGTSSLRWH